MGSSVIGRLKMAITWAARGGSMLKGELECFVQSLWMRQASMTRKVKDCSFLGAYSRADAVIPARASAATNPLPGPRVSTLPILATALAVRVTSITGFHSSWPGTNTLQPPLIVGIWQVVSFLLSPLVYSDLCFGECWCWLFGLLWCYILLCEVHSCGGT